MRAAEVPAGFGLRIASVDDAEALAALINEVNIAEVGIPWKTTDEVRGDLSALDRVPENDVIAIDGSGALAAYLTLSFGEGNGPDGTAIANMLVYTRPDLWGRGLSRWLLSFGERRIEGARREMDLADVAIHVACWSTNVAAQRLFQDLGFDRARTFLQLRRTLDEPIDARTPTGIEIRRFDVQMDARRTHAALAEAFGDHWGRAFDAYDRWVHDHFDGPAAASDLGLWFVAVDGQNVVGAVCTRLETEGKPDTATVDELGVRRAWRGRGIARALLLTTFEAARERGIDAIELGVDAANPTGATRLYERAGMRVVRSFEIWEKRLPADAATS